MNPIIKSRYTSEVSAVKRLNSIKQPEREKNQGGQFYEEGKLMGKEVVRGGKKGCGIVLDWNEKGVKQRL